MPSQCSCPLQGFNAFFLFLLLLPLSFVYSCFAWLNRKLKSPAKFPLPVIAVGNLTVGGTGKTPVTVYIARLLLSLGKHPVILSRGYGSGNEGENIRVIAGKNQYGEMLSCKQVGDEAMEMSMQLPDVPLLVGGKRKENLQAWLQTEEGKTCDSVLLDDGLQHHAIKKDFNICLIDAKRGLGNRFALPAGPLREAVLFTPLPDMLLWTRIEANKDGSVKELPLLPASLESLPQSLSSFEIDAFSCLLKKEGASPLPVSSFAGQSVLLVSGLGNNAQFRKSIEKRGIKVVKHFCYSDHFPYREEDIYEIYLYAKKEKVKTVLTTQKDGVKIEPLLARLNGAEYEQDGVKYFSASLSVSFPQQEGYDDETELIKRIKKLVA